MGFTEPRKRARWGIVKAEGRREEKSGIGDRRVGTETRPIREAATGSGEKRRKGENL